MRTCSAGLGAGNIRVDLDGEAPVGFSCAYSVALVHGRRRYLSGFGFNGSVLVCRDPPYLRLTRNSAQHYRHDVASVCLFPRYCILEADITSPKGLRRCAIRCLG